MNICGANSSEQVTFPSVTTFSQFLQQAVAYCGAILVCQCNELVVNKNESGTCKRMLGERFFFNEFRLTSKIKIIYFLLDQKNIFGMLVDFSHSMS